MIDKLKAVLKEYQDEPCWLQGVRCRECKFNIRVELYDGLSEQMRVCDVLEYLSEVLEVD